MAAYKYKNTFYQGLNNYYLGPFHASFHFTNLSEIQTKQQQPTWKLGFSYM